MSDATQIQCPHCGQPYSTTPEQRQQYVRPIRSPAPNASGHLRVGPVGVMPPIAAQPMNSLPPGFGPPPGGAYGGIPYGQPDAAYAPQQGNGMATASLVLGAALMRSRFCGLLAVIFGILGIVRARTIRPCARRGKAWPSPA